MNSYQPQQQQPQYRPNRAALWVNSSKSNPNQPDYKGNVEISWATLQELTAAFNAGQYEQDRGGQPCIKLDFALYAQQGGVSASGRAKPILSGQVSSLAETQQSAQMRQQAAANRAGYGGPAQQPQAPQGYAPAPMPMQPQAPQQPAYQPEPVPAQPQPMYQQPPQQPAPAAPAPMPQQQPVPVAAPPPMPAQPMPGAIHGQPPMAPAPTLPQGF